MSDNKFELLSIERKRLQDEGEVPMWYTTQGYAMFKTGYQYGDETVKGAFRRVAKTLAKWDPRPDAEEKFFELIWSSKIALSTPVLSNTGTTRGMPVSCSGNYVGDSIQDFYSCNTELAILSKNGFGTASYLGDIRPRGSLISSTGNKANGVVPVFDTYVDTKTKVAQGGRRGEWAGYVDVSHGDFEELVGYVHKDPAASHVGWVYEKEDYEALKNKDPEALHRWNEVLYTRARFGKGYMWKNWVANELAPQAIKNSGIRIRGSQLCTEIALPADEQHTFTCVLSSFNLKLWDEFTDEDIKWGVRLLDAVCSEFIELAKDQPYMEKAVRFTEKARAIGLGTLAFHTYLQDKMIPFESGEAHMINNQIYSRLFKVSKIASAELAQELGEPEWCKGTGLRNATLITIAPNMSSALLCGGVSQGVEPIICNAFIQQTNSGDFVRSNPKFVEIAKEKGMYSDELMDSLAIDWNGSVQHLDWLSDNEKAVFKTAYEIDQHSIIRLASARQRHIDQAQSINLFFSSDAPERYIASVHKMFMDCPRLKSLYYLRSERVSKASDGKASCVACEG
ncbi:MAG: ribonucleoside-diphosphate reductase subunit alpha [Bacilli bacterium]